jgi:AraC-like DNA-binding protein
MSNTDQHPSAAGELDLQDRLEVGLLRVGARPLGRQWRYADLHAPYWRLYCNHQDGARIHPLDGPPIHLAARRRYLIPPWVHFASESREGVAHVFCHFDLLGMPGALIRAWFPSPIRLRSDPALEQAVLELGDRMAAGGAITAGGACAWKAAVHAALAEALDALPAREQPRLLRHTRTDLPFAKALHHIHAHLGENLSNGALAARCGMGSDHLIRLFRRHLDQTPLQYVQERRLAAAARDLVQGDEGIEVVAERYGFPNRFYFTRVFTRRMGQPPAAWRRRQQEAAGRR